MLEKIIRDFMTIWTTIDPISNLALFAGLTAAMHRTERRRIAWRASLYAAIILVVAVVIGQIVLDAMGIRLRSLQVAGGLILCVFGLQMVFGWIEQTGALCRQRSGSGCFSAGGARHCRPRCDHGRDLIDR